MEASLKFRNRYFKLSLVWYKHWSYSLDKNCYSSIGLARLTGFKHCFTATCPMCRTLRLIQSTADSYCLSGHAGLCTGSCFVVLNWLPTKAREPNVCCYLTSEGGGVIYDPFFKGISVETEPSKLCTPIPLIYIYIYTHYSLPYRYTPIIW